jgi:uncharacterized protein
MQRLILLILIGFIANWYWRNLQRQREAAGRARRAANETGASRAPEAAANARSARGPQGTNGAQGTSGAQGRAGAAKGQAGQLALPEPMVRCAHCDTYLPVSEATVSLGRHFCGPKHAHDYAVRVAQAGDGR